MRTALGRALSSFGRFWWDFLVGDTPEMFVATVVVVALAFWLRSSRWVAIVVLPALVICVLVTSALRGRRRG
jgi:hypothetical protein